MVVGHHLGPVRYTVCMPASHKLVTQSLPVDSVSLARSGVHSYAESRPPCSVVLDQSRFGSPLPGFTRSSTLNAAWRSFPRASVYGLRLRQWLVRI